MSPIRLSALLALAAVAAACSQDAPTSVQASDEPSYIGFLSWGKDGREICVDENGQEVPLSECSESGNQ